MNDIALFLIPALIWGSTWMAIRFQLGVVDPTVSIAYRFLGAGMLLLLYCLGRRVSLRLSWRRHAVVALQGILLFSISYWTAYLAELDLPSGLVAVVFCGILFANILNGRIFLKTPIGRPIVIGGLMGLAGLGLIFLRDLTAFSASTRSLAALGLALIGVEVASLGDILSARTQQAGISVLQANTLGMLWAGMTMLAIAAVTNRPLVFDASFRYVASLAYLSVFGSIVAFACFLTLLGRIGAARASYVSLVSPIIALTLTTVFESYKWTPAALSGVALVLLGDFVALRDW
jgi:drug/metabolite transporter (DMT)-like permease